jgi:hypothetical protein
LSFLADINRCNVVSWQKTDKDENSNKILM